MTDSLRPHEIQQVWQSQQVEVVKMSTEELRSKAARFQKKVGRRNLREYLGAAVAIGMFGFGMYLFHGVALRAGLALLIAGVLYVVYHMHRRAGSKDVPSELAWQSCIEFHRQEMERQRDYLRDIWRWGILPMTPGVVLFSVAASFRDPSDLPVFVGSAVFCFLVFCAIYYANRKAADKLDRQIVELAALEREV